MTKFRLDLKAVGITTARAVKINMKNSKDYKKVTWGLYRYPPCAVVGGGPSVKNHLKKLRNFEGKIYAINDTAGYLSDNGIKCTLYSIDGTKIPFKIGENVEGALLATRCHKKQYEPFPKSKIRTFNMMEDDSKEGIEGGPTGVCRTPHLLIKMGHSRVNYYGIEGCFFGQSHVGGMRGDAKNNMIIIRVKGINYITNAAFMLQNEYMAGLLNAYPKIYRDYSGGLLEKMRKYPDDWEVVAVSNDIKEQHEAQGCDIWKKPFDATENPIWTG